MTKIISVVNQKGGVGKTTTTINLGTALAATGKKTCIIDLDPQGNASTGLGIDRNKRQKTSYHLLMEGAHDAQVALPTAIKKLSIVPATIDLSGAEIELVNVENRELRLKKSLQLLIENNSFDYILIDCPPSLGLLTMNALVATQTVLIPLQCEFYALEGVSHLLKTIRIVKSRYNPTLEMEGVVLTMYDRRNKLTENIEEDVRNYLGKQVYDTVIPRNVRVSEAPSHGKPSLLYDLKCAGSQAYVRLAAELIKRNKFMADALMKEVA